MTIFGLLWLALFFTTLLTNKIEYIVAMTILSSTLQCSNVFWYGGQGVGPQLITSFLFVIYVFIKYWNGHLIKVSKKIGSTNFLVIVVFLIAFISCIYNKVLAHSGLRLMQLGVYVATFFCMQEAGKHMKAEEVYKMMRNITWFLIIEGFLQLLITTGFLPRTAIINELLYNDLIYMPEQNVTYFSRDNYFRVLATYMEPSYYAGYIVGAFFYFLGFKERRGENRILLALIVAQIILTFSSTAYGAFCIGLLIYVLRTRNVTNKIQIVIVGALGVGIMYFAFYDVLDMVLFSKMQSGSANARLGWNRAAARLFLNSPIIGNGYKTSRASSIFYTLLAEQGIIGTLAYGLVNISLALPILVKKSAKRMCYGEEGVRYALLIGALAQLIAVPDLDICTYWMWMNVLGLTIMAKKANNDSKIKTALYSATV